ncbi:MAG: SDR family NAD(P)-dependent oxidoreductase [Bacteroidetes bacterium]|nr:MAG: SDR family NAD(P)-dependent oxidoreductase [Bacteroidota bacterium]
MTRTALITGAGGALGGAVAEAFADAGWRLALLAHRADTARDLSARHPDALVLTADLTDEAATRGVVDRVLERFGRVDALLGLAGGFAMGPAHEASSGDLDRLLALNVRTLFNSVRAVLPAMRDRGDGFILGVSAAAAEEGGSGMALYAASKAAVAAYLRALRAEVREQGVRVTTLFPMGALDTPANREAMPEADPSGWIDLKDLAATILHAAERDPRGHVGELKVYATPARSA